MGTILSTVSAVLVYSGAILLALLVLTEYIASVKGNSRKDKYPFESTMRVLANQYRLLDFFSDEQANFKKKDGAETLLLKYFQSEQFVMTSSIENITHVLKDVDNYGKGPGFSKRFNALLGTGIFNADGDLW
jgi:hypothetical protein